MQLVLQNSFQIFEKNLESLLSNVILHCKEYSFHKNHFLKRQIFLFFSFFQFPCKNLNFSHWLFSDKIQSTILLYFLLFILIITYKMLYKNDLLHFASRAFVAEMLATESCRYNFTTVEIWRIKVVWSFTIKEIFLNCKARS